MKSNELDWNHQLNWKLIELLECYAINFKCVTMKDVTNEENDAAC